MICDIRTELQAPVLTLSVITSIALRTKAHNVSDIVSFWF